MSILLLVYLTFWVAYSITEFLQPYHEFLVPTTFTVSRHPNDEWYWYRIHYQIRNNTFYKIHYASYDEVVNFKSYDHSREFLISGFYHKDAPGITHLISERQNVIPVTRKTWQFMLISLFSLGLICRITDGSHLGFIISHIGAMIIFRLFYSPFVRNPRLSI